MSASAWSLSVIRQSLLIVDRWLTAGHETTPRRSLIRAAQGTARALRRLRLIFGTKIALINPAGKRRGGWMKSLIIGLCIFG